MAKFSASAIDIFLECPYRYYLGYIQKVPSVQTAPLLFGDKVHKAKEDFHKWILANHPPVEYFEQYMHTVVDKRCKEIPQHIFDEQKIQAHEVYDKFFAEYLNFFIFNKLYEKQIVPEYWFSLPLAPDILLRGAVDLWVKPDIVIDFKTSKFAPQVKDLINKTQSKVYSLITEGPTTFIYLYTRNPMQMRQMQISTPKQEIRNDLIQTCRFIMGTTNYEKTYRNCDWCPYKETCLKGARYGS
jgi:CRISPR/Cas system-associated exonuclease Cas4 (RecB family)